jgi:hypothetical protein
MIMSHILKFFRCKQSWEELNLKHNFTYFAHICFCLVLSAISTILHLEVSTNYCHFWNFWVKCVQSFDMDVTEGATWAGLGPNIEFLFTVLGATTCYLLGYAPILDDLLALIATMLLRCFQIKVCDPPDGFITEEVAYGVRTDYLGWHGHFAGFYANVCLSDSPKPDFRKPCGGTVTYRLCQALAYFVVVRGVSTTEKRFRNTSDPSLHL